MGLNYSFGITFNNKKDADACCNEFRNLKISLPDKNVVELFSSVSENADNYKLH